MTSREIVDSFSEALMRDERILSDPERELLASLLQRANNHADPRNHAVAEALAHAVGETIAQRAYSVLGNSITQRLIEQRLSSSATGLFEDTESGQGAGPHPPSPSPPAPSPGMVRSAGPHPPSPSPPAPSPGMVRGAGPHPPSPSPPAPSPGATTARELSSSGVTVVDVPEDLPAQCVVLEEFLAPQELDGLIQYTLEREKEFQISEVVSPGVTGGTVDYEHRRSRVLRDLGTHRAVIINRIHACLPRVLEKIGHERFTISQVEAEVTASNDGDFFRCHSDNGHEENVSREITFVYFFHHEPKKFRGGELRIYDSRWEGGAYRPTENHRVVVPGQNQIVLFPSSLAHEITKVECPSQAFSDSRFTVNGWFHR